MKSVLCLNFKLEAHTVAAVALSYVYERLQDAEVPCRFVDEQVVRRYAITEDVVAVSLPLLDWSEFRRHYRRIRYRSSTALIVVGGQGVAEATTPYDIAQMRKYPDVWWYPQSDLGDFLAFVGASREHASFYTTPLRWSGYTSEQLAHGVHRVMLLTATHCPHRCVFCASAGKYKLRDQYVPIQELDNLHRKGVRRYDYGDSSMVYNPRWREYAQYSSERRMIFGCITDCRRGAAMLDDLWWMSSRGMYYCIYGVETLNQKALEVMRKGVQVQGTREFLSGLRKMRASLKWPYHQSAFLIAGLPYQTYADALDDVAACRAAGIRHMELSVLHSSGPVRADRFDDVEFDRGGCFLRSRWVTDYEAYLLYRLSDRVSGAALREEISHWYTTDPDRVWKKLLR